MKTLFLTIFLAALSLSSTSASGRMLFSQYEEGYAIFRGGARAAAAFNYDKVEQRMMFIDNEGEVMILLPDDVIAVVIGERTFVPSGDNNAFNERFSINNNVLFVRHRIEPRIDTSGGIAFGARQLSAHIVNPNEEGGMSVMGTSNMHTSFVQKDIESASNVYFRDNSRVFIHNGNRFVEINSLRSLTRLFSRAQRSQIEDFARQNNTSFRDTKNVKAIVVYALSL